MLQTVTQGSIRLWGTGCLRSRLWFWQLEGRSVRTSHECDLRICGNESRPGPQLVEKLATPLVLVKYVTALSKRHEKLRPPTFAAPAAGASVCAGRNCK